MAGQSSETFIQRRPLLGKIIIKKRFCLFEKIFKKIEGAASTVIGSVMGLAVKNF